jgi:hypothetical protein
MHYGKYCVTNGANRSFKTDRSVERVLNITCAYIQELPRIPGTETKQWIFEEVRIIHLQRPRRTDTRLMKTNKKERKERKKTPRNVLEFTQAYGLQPQHISITGQLSRRGTQ